MLDTFKKLQDEGFISRAELEMVKKSIKAGRKDLLKGFFDVVSKRLEEADIKLTQKELVAEAKEIIRN